MISENIYARPAEFTCRVAVVKDLTEISQALEGLRRPLVLLLLSDGTTLSDGAIVDATRELLGHDLAYACTWGPGCERVHDLIDRAIVEKDPEQNLPHVMTTWHSEDELSDAIWYFLFVAVPTDGWPKSPPQRLVLSVDHSDWAEDVKRIFTRPRLGWTKTKKAEMAARRLRRL